MPKKEKIKIMPKKEKIKIMPKKEEVTGHRNYVNSQLKDQTLQFITEKYELAKTAINNGSVKIPDIKALTKEYDMSSRKIVETFDNFANNKGLYAMLINDDTRQKQLLSDIKQIKEYFTKLVNPIIDTKLMALIAEEEDMNRIAREEEEEKQKAAEKALEAERKRLEDEERAAALREQQIKDEMAARRAENLKKLGGNAIFITSRGVEQKIKSAWF
jgi:hypothetical protein